jgi:hypothetical protein
MSAVASVSPTPSVSQCASWPPRPGMSESLRSCCRTARRAPERPSGRGSAGVPRRLHTNGRSRSRVRAQATGMRASSPSLHGGGEGPRGEARQGPSRVLDGTVLLLDVLPHDARRRPADGPGEGGPGPQALRAPVMLDEVGELLPQAAGGDALEAGDQLRDGHLGRVVDQKVHVVGLAVELGPARPRSPRRPRRPRRWSLPCGAGAGRRTPGAGTSSGKPSARA